MADFNKNTIAIIAAILLGAMIIGGAIIISGNNNNSSSGSGSSSSTNSGSSTSSESSSTSDTANASIKTFTLPNGVKLEMVKVEPGSFTMSKRDGENFEFEVEHQKTLTKPFYIGKYEVTQAQWKAIIGTSISEQRDKANRSWPLCGEGDNYPVYYVSWHEAMQFCEKMNKYAPSGWQFTLPTETQWEFAARGGNKSRGYKYSGSDNLDDVGWYHENSGNSRLNDSQWDFDKVMKNNCRTHEVGRKKPNELGLYDMSGNVWEWCLDNWESKSNNTRAEFTRPYNDSDGSGRVGRGGGWCYFALYCRSAFRSYYSPGGRYYDLGFRLALVPAE